MGDSHNENDKKCLDDALKIAKSVGKRISDVPIGEIKDRQLFGRQEDTNHLASAAAGMALIQSYQHCMDGNPLPPFPTEKPPQDSKQR